MDLIKGSYLVTEHIEQFYSDINASIERLPGTITYTYDIANNLYNTSSTLEDILTDYIYSFYNQLNSITYSYTGSSAVFSETFKSTEYIDKNFQVDKELNIDSNNETLTLPIKSTTKINIISAIVEPDSNGSYGDSLNGFINAGLKSIFDNDLATVFEYEKFSNIFEVTPIKLVLTTKLDSESVVNSIYIKLFSGNNIAHASVDSIELSRDSENWIEIEDFIDNSSLTSNDHYIRFLSKRARYIRISFSQNVAQILNTDFGVKHRYSIGIREIEVFRNEFDYTGEYVSVPFSTGKPVKRVKLTSDYLENDDMYFFISANNGGKWLDITPNLGESIDILELDTGVMMPNNLRSIRVRIQVIRKASQEISNISETFSVLQGQLYTLKYKPINLQAMLGGHISYGDIVKYNLSMPAPYNILNEVYKNSGYKIVYNKLTEEYTVYNNSHTDENKPLASPETLDKCYEAIDLDILAHIGKNYSETIKFVPYTDTINNDLEVFVGNEIIDKENSFSNDEYITIWILSRILPHPISTHSYLFLDLDNLCQFKTDQFPTTSDIEPWYDPVYEPELDDIVKVTVRVEYVDIDGNNLLDPIEFLLEKGEEYSSEEEIIDGYNLVSSPKIKAGIVGDDSVTLTYIYQEIIEPEKP